jgi:hypothetical protein
MFLPCVEQAAKPSPYLDAVRQMQPAGNEYPQIWHLFAFAPHATQHLGPPASLPNDDAT